MRETNENDERKSSRTKQLLAAAMAASALSGCTTYSVPEYEAHRIIIGEGFIFDGTNIRQDPIRIEDHGVTNRCGKPDKAIVFDIQTGWLAEDTDNNGDWIGFKPQELKEGLCEDDPDNRVWINRDLVVAEVIPD